MQQWQAMTVAGGIGKRFAAGNWSAEDAVAHLVDWLTFMRTRDNLGVNDCIVALEEETIEANIAAGIEGASDVSMWSTGCAGHSSILGMKPVYYRLDGMPNKLVRLANLLDSGRTASKFQSAQTLSEPPQENNACSLKKH